MLRGCAFARNGALAEFASDRCSCLEAIARTRAAYIESVVHLVVIVVGERRMVPFVVIGAHRRRGRDPRLRSGSRGRGRASAWRTQSCGARGGGGETAGGSRAALHAG